MKLLLDLENDAPPWEEECEYCQGRGLILPPVSESSYDCSHCHGTGHRSYQLAGSVDTKHDLDCMAHGIVRYTIFAALNFLGTQRVLAALTAAFRDKTLPADLLYDPTLRPWGLRKVRIEGESNDTH